MLQARRLGKELFVGIHSDEAILENKGPTVMTLEERSAGERRADSELMRSECQPSRPVAGPRCPFPTLPT